MKGTEKAGLAVAVVTIVAGTAVSGVFNDQVKDILGISRPTPVTIVGQDPPVHSPRDEAVSTRQLDLQAIRDFRWKIESAMNVFSTTGDALPSLRLSVDGLQPLSAEHQEMFESLRRQGAEQMRQEGTLITTHVTAWDIKSVNDQEARIDAAWEMKGVEKGQPVQRRMANEVRLVKVDGQWLMSHTK